MESAQNGCEFMAASIYVAEKLGANPANPDGTSVWLDDTGCYWHLYRYFEGAKVQRKEELIDLYGSTEIEGYELDQLEDKLVAAREDANHKPDEWKVLTGWITSPARENEIWEVVKKTELLEIIAKILWLIEFARANKLKLINHGD
jgi:hypothetical protein